MRPRRISPEITASDPIPVEMFHLDYRPIDSFTAFGRKARSHTRAQILAIAKSMETFGFCVPVLVDDAGALLAGHARIEAARLLGLKQAPAVVLSHLTSEQKRAFILAENRLAELAGWDRDVLRIELEELSAIDLDFDLTVIGFSAPEIDAIMFVGEGGGERGDDVPAMPTEAVSAIGDLWLLGEHRIYCGDALAQTSLDAVLAGDQARAVFTDPPYNVAVGGHVTSSKQHGEFVMASGEMSDAEFTAFLTTVWEQICASLVPGGLAYLCIDWRHMNHVFQGAANQPLDFLNLLIWDKKAGGMGSFYRSRHELIFLMRKQGEGHINRVELGKHGRDRSNVWAYEGVSGFGAAKAKTREMHPTVKPLALVRDAILDCTAKGDIVLDFFCGSGTTIIAAHDSKRRGRAIELDPKYVDVSVIRWQDFSGQKARLAATGETFLDVRIRREREASAKEAS